MLFEVRYLRNKNDKKAILEKAFKLGEQANNFGVSFPI